MTNLFANAVRRRDRPTALMKLVNSGPQSPHLAEDMHSPIPAVILGTCAEGNPDG